MAEVLTHPQLGYYSRQDPFGRDGDFITAPEVSQMFGELIGLWAVAGWQAQGAPNPFRLVELGPGRGTLMADALRAARLVPDFLAAAEIDLVEVSPSLRERQRQALAGQRVTWHERLDELPEQPLVLIANEFFDALPIRQFQQQRGCWHERVIGLNPTGDGLVFGLAPPLPEPAAFDLPTGASEGAIAEHCPAGQAIAGEIARRLATRGGLALIIDYGYGAGESGDTLQAVRRHDRHDVLEAPGKADLTAHVDFAALALTARAAGAAVHGPVTQGDFLSALGLAARAERLSAKATPSQARDIAAAKTRLVAPAEMGRLFKVLALTPTGAPTPAGFPVSSPAGEG
jgi:NADH dehydrogenase [ubiquinone] 1 alpha subcomplex assembly factor 7